MLVLIGIGLLAGLVTALSPCVLPVLPILLAGSAAGGTRRPYAIIAGLITSFTVFTLTASWLLDQLGLPQDFLRNAAIVMLVALAAILVVPQIGDLVSRPLSRIARRPGGDLGGGFLLGASLGLVFVPCAGPVLAAVTVVAATQEVGGRAVALTLAYAVGAAVPMLLIAAGGQRLLRPFAPRLRQVFGVVIFGTALAIAFGFDRPFQTALPGYTEALQSRIERSGSAKRELGRVTGGGAPRGTEAQGTSADDEGDGLPDFGPAPEFRGIVEWQNSEALTLEGLRGRVVLIDFWTYSCVNCLRTLPYLDAWYREYERDGLTIVGVHAPEFAFERVPSNVSRASRELGVDWPVALDNGFETWRAWRNQYWPAKYLVDRRGHVRYAHFGEGEYAETEEAIRELLGEDGDELVSVGVEADTSSRALVTPETYLGWLRIESFIGDRIERGVRKRYRLAKSIPQNHISYGGEWTVEKERILAGENARLKLHFRARDIHLVLEGKGTVEALVDGKPAGVTRVSESELYTLLRLPEVAEGELELRFSPGVAGYAFTFG